MLLKLMIVNNYIPLLSNGISFLEWRPQTGITGILGSNGSGKSSLVRIACPLAGDRSLFGPEGSVYCEYDKDGEVYGVGYEVKGGKLVHHFTRGEDREELNRGGTGKEQDDLAAQIFGYTRTIHQCLTGRLRFSALGPMKRAELLQDVVAIDVKEAEKVYESLRSQLRDLQGSHSHVSSKVIMYQDNILSSDNISANVEAMEMCHTGIEFLRSKVVAKPSVAITQFENDYADNISRLGRVSSLVLKAKPLTDLPFDLINTPEYEMAHSQSLIESTNSRITEYSAEFLELERSLGEGDIDYAKLKDDTINKVVVAQASLLALGTTWIGIDIDDEDVAVSLKQLINFYDFCNVTIPLLSDATLNTTTTAIAYYVKHSARLADLSDELSKLNNQVESGSNWLVRVESTEKEKCPKCSHHYWKDYDPQDVTRIKDSLTALDARRPGLVADILALTTELNSISSFRQNLGLVVESFGEVHPQLGRMIMPLFLNDDGTYQDNVFSRHVIMSQLRTIVDGLTARVTSVELAAEIVYNSNLVEKIANLVDGNVYEQLSRRSFELTSLIGNGMETLDKTKVRMEKLKVYIKEREQYVAWGIEIDHLMEGLLRATEGILTYYEYECNDTSYRALQHRLAANSDIIANSESNRILLADAEKDLDAINDKIAKLGVLIKGISPQTGLIAKELTNGINQFTTLMNKMIAEMWEYSMVIEPCDLDKGKLSYRFPVSIKAATPLKDIVEGSDGQKQIVDFVFSMLYIAQKGLRDFPLILDEPSTGLDHKHLGTFFDHIKRMASEGFCSQIFLISHIFGIMGDFADLDLIVLDEDNVSGLSDLTYNKNITLC